ncbi:T cell receptor alpha chain MC.7.G5-like [Heteronotia binoei]|uniref:T cell receptor alpha chain MC.7.G5-like n=1 Tax=Heteronotia binoei TaxID=13085 RepID=UPI00292FD474|nr:T cell receptor alpha chain MC.7.G5-like [Heteronotia binoei]
MPNAIILFMVMLFSLGIPCDAQIEQDSLVIASEGSQVNLSCRHPSSTTDTIFWYRQFPGQTVHYILSGYYSGSNSSAPKGALVVPRDRKENVFSIAEAALLDSAVYYCVLSATAVKIIFGSGTRMVIFPILEDSEPSLYKLKPQKGEDQTIDACLITDYSPGNISARLNNASETSDSSLVIMNDGPSYGTVLWDSVNGSFSCEVDHEGRAYQLNRTEDADDACQTDFETDERLNFLSITVLGLRIIFLKSVAINLLLTFRFWSC